MGRIKALLPHPDGSGRSWIEATAGTLLASGLDPLFVVLGSAHRDIGSALDRFGGRVRRIRNPQWESGMLSSLQAGIRRVGEETDAAWALVAPTDQPFLSVDLVRRLLAATTGAGRARPAAVVPATATMEARGSWGLPVVLHRRLFSEVLALTPRPDGPDRGAGRLLARHRKDLITVPATPRELLDVDTSEESRSLLDNPPNPCHER